MHRIDTKTAQVDKFGAGKNGYTNGDKTVGRLATQLDADVFDAFQEEICGVIEAAEIALNKADRAQLLKALKSLFLNKSENLGDLNNVAKALENLGLNNVGNWPAVQANGGKHSSGDHHINVDWNDAAGKLYGTVDDTDVGEFFTTQNKPTPAQVGAYPMTGGNLADDASVTAMSSFNDGNAGESLYTPMIRVTMRGRGGDMDFKDGGSACFRLVEVISNYAYAEILVDGWGSVQSFQFRNDGSIHAPSSVYAGQGFIAPDGNIYGPTWGGYLNNWIVAQINALNIAINQSINNVANTANDAWNKGNDAQLNRVQDVALGARWTGVLPGGGGLESPAAGYVMTGWYTEGQNPGGDTLVFRPVQKYVPSMGWVNVGHTA